MNDSITTVYLSGPMTGLPGFNYEAFRDAADALRARGYFVLNPADDNGGDTTTTEFPLSLYLRKDIHAVLCADAIVVLPGWQGSPGARLEVRVAQAIDIPIFNYPDLDPMRDNVLTVVEPAQGNMKGDRKQSYHASPGLPRPTR